MAGIVSDVWAAPFVGDRFLTFPGEDFPLLIGATFDVDDVGTLAGRRRGGSLGPARTISPDGSAASDEAVRDGQPHTAISA